MADVLHGGLSEGSLFRLLAAIAIWKSFEIAMLGGLLVALPILAAGLVVFVRRTVGAGMIAFACLAIIATPSVYGQASVNHLTWVFWVSLTMALVHGQQQRFVLQAQLSIMYGFAALAKIWPAFLSGAALKSATWVGTVVPTWLLVTAAWATLVLEAILAVGVWLRRPWWTISFWLAVSMHGSFLIFTVTDPWRIGRLVIFGGLSIAVWLRIRYLLLQSGGAPAGASASESSAF